MGSVRDLWLRARLRCYESRYAVSFFQLNLIFNSIFRDPDLIFSKINISDEHKEMLLATLRRKLTLNPLKIRVDFSLTCTNYDGVEAIREALLTAKNEVNDETWNLEFKMIAPPHYKCEVITHNRIEGEAKLK